MDEGEVEGENNQNNRNHMLFDGPRFSVNILRYLEILRIDDMEFDRGTGRESMYFVHLNAALVDVHLRNITGKTDGVVERIIERLNECYSPTLHQKLSILKSSLTWYIASLSVQCI